MYRASILDFDNDFCHTVIRHEATSIDIAYAESGSIIRNEEEVLSMIHPASEGLLSL